MGLRVVDNGTIFDPAGDYGAAYDGETDDTAAIQACIDACSALGGGPVEIRSVGGLLTSTRRVVLDADLVVKDGVWLRGLGATTTLTGAGSIRLPDEREAIAFADRVTISDLTWQSSGAVAVDLDNAGSTGGMQLGFPRITLENLFMVDPVGIAVRIALGPVFETRLLNILVMRGETTGIAILGTDDYMSHCTVGGESSGGGAPAFQLTGGNHHVAICKGFGYTGAAFAVGGAGRHTIVGCEAQDCGIGFDIQSSNNSLAGIVADTCDIGVSINGNGNSVTGTLMGPGGGGTGVVMRVGALIAMGARNNDIRITTDSVGALVAVAGDFAGNSVHVNGQDGYEDATYAATFTPNLRTGRTKKMTLTGNLAVKCPLESWPGVRLVFLLKQDATGSRTITFDSCYRTNASWSPALAANTTERIEFEHDGTRWVQCGALPVTDRAAIATDDFNRANGTIGTAVTGQTWGTSDAKMVVTSNKANAPTASNFTITTHAWIDAGVSDATVQATMLDDQAFLTFRVVDATNYYHWTNGVVARVVAGVSTRIDAGGGTFTTNDVLKVTAVGGTLRCYKNGTLVMILPASSHLGATKFGVGIAHSASLGVDDFSVT